VILVHPEGWAKPAGYTDGVLAPTGRVLFLSGQVGWNPVTALIETDDFARQAEQALENVVAVLKASGSGPGQVVRLTWYVTDRQAYIDSRKEIGASYRRLFGRHYPAMSVVVVAGLLEERARLEIEATAVIPHTVEKLGT
jgi:enamine deaminase RidA (YjgF/YER057c/UK114 family)